MIIHLMESAKGLNAAKLMTEANLNLPLTLPLGQNDEDCCSSIVFITSEHKQLISEIGVNYDDLVIDKKIFYPLPRKVEGLTSSEDRLGYLLLKPLTYTVMKHHVNDLLSRKYFSLT